MTSRASVNDVHKSISHCKLYFYLFFYAVVIEFSIHKVLLYQNLYVFMYFTNFVL